MDPAHGADEATQFFDAAQNHDTSPAALSEEEKEQLRDELKKTEDEIATLRQVLQARVKHAQELKRKLGISGWSEFQQDISQGIRNVKETPALQRTTEIVHDTTDAVAKKLSALRSSNAFKSFEDKLGSAYTSVKKGYGYSKSKIVSSTSVHGNLHTDSFPEEEKEGTASAPSTNVSTPNAEKKGLN